jgi:hypothetical protein
MITSNADAPPWQSSDHHNIWAVAAEWEIAAIYGLAQQGDIRVPETRENTREPDLVYASRTTDAEVLVEITAISDASLHERNPVEAFKAEFQRIFIKEKLHQLGGTHTQIGHVDTLEGLILAVPDRKDMATFFASAEFRDFLRRIRAAPSREHVLRFQARGAQSALTFRPGRPIGGAGHLVHTVLTDPVKNSITGRLKKKDEQIRKSKLELPAIVILCDANCRALNTTMPSVGRPTIEQVVHLFLGGQPHVARGPRCIQGGVTSSSRRINAVALWSLHEELNVVRRGPAARWAKCRLLLNRCETYHAAAKEALAEIADAIRHLPPIERMPLNALRLYAKPTYYGGSTMSGGGTRHALKTKISLLTLQRVLTGEIKYDEFARDHAALIRVIKRATDNGAMISEVRIEQTPDRDDDWIEFVFGAPAPGQLFKR